MATLSPAGIWSDPGWYSRTGVVVILDGTAAREWWRGKLKYSNNSPLEFIFVIDIRYCGSYLSVIAGFFSNGCWAEKWYSVVVRGVSPWLLKYIIYVIVKLQ
jgi:hypothetical protein